MAVLPSPLPPHTRKRIARMKTCGVSSGSPRTLGRALDATLKLGRLADGTRQLARVLQLMPNPALLLDGKGRITLANTAAESLLRTGDGLTLDRGSGGFFATRRGFARGNRRFVPCLGEGDGGCIRYGLPSSAEPLRLTRPSGLAPLLVLPVLLPPPAFALWDLLEPARVLVLDRRPERAIAGHGCRDPDNVRPDALPKRVSRC